MYIFLQLHTSNVYFRHIFIQTYSWSVVQGSWTFENKERREFFHSHLQRHHSASVISVLYDVRVRIRNNLHALYNGCCLLRYGNVCYPINLLKWNGMQQRVLEFIDNKYALLGVHLGIPSVPYMLQPTIHWIFLCISLIRGKS